MPAKFNPDDYIDVQERINRFWSENPDGAIWTELLTTADEFNRVVARAMVFRHRPPSSGRFDLLPDATGIAAEERGADIRAGANFTSWHENAETSAIGRALANMGYATSRHDRPSRQEIEKAVRHGGEPIEDARQTQPNAPQRTEPARERPNAANGKPAIQNPNSPATPPQLNFIRGLAKDCGYVILGPDGDDHLDEIGFAAYVGATWQVDWPAITKGIASGIIEQLQAERDEKRRQASFVGPDPDRHAR